MKIKGDVLFSLIIILQNQQWTPKELAENFVALDHPPPIFYMNLNKHKMLFHFHFNAFGVRWDTMEIFFFKSYGRFYIEIISNMLFRFHFEASRILFQDHQNILYFGSSENFVFTDHPPPFPSKTLASFRNSASIPQALSHIGSGTWEEL